MNTHKIYCFSLYCQGNGMTKSQAFVSIRTSEEKAIKRAVSENLRQFPVSEGWYNHQFSMVVIPEKKILMIAKELQD